MSIVFRFSPRSKETDRSCPMIQRHSERGDNPEDVMYECFEEARRRTRQAKTMYVIRNTYMVRDILTGDDGMATSLEVRVPFLDHAS